MQEFIPRPLTPTSITGEEAFHDEDRYEVNNNALNSYDDETEDDDAVPRWTPPKTPPGICKTDAVVLQNPRIQFVAEILIEMSHGTSYTPQTPSSTPPRHNPTTSAQVHLRRLRLRAAESETTRAQAELRHHTNFPTKSSHSAEDLRRLVKTNYIRAGMSLSGVCIPEPGKVSECETDITRVIRRRAFYAVAGSPSVLHGDVKEPREVLYPSQAISL